MANTFSCCVNNTSILQRFLNCILGFLVTGMGIFQCLIIPNDDWGDACPLCTSPDIKFH